MQNTCQANRLLYSFTFLSPDKKHRMNYVSFFVNDFLCLSGLIALPPMQVLIVKALPIHPHTKSMRLRAVELVKQTVQCQKLYLRVRVSPSSNLTGTGRCSGQWPAFQTDWMERMMASTSSR